MLQSHSDISFRPINDNDLPFLQTLYGTTRAAELAMVPWSDDQKSNFIEMQFRAQHTYYQQQFSDADFNIVVKGDTAIGRLYTDERDEEIRIIDIVLLPDYQRQGIGKALLQDIMQQAKELRVPVTIHVEKNNPAMVLYQALGFELVEDQGVYDLMRWQSSR